MERIIVLVVMLLVFGSNVSKAQYYGYRYRVRYSPYAFSHKYPSGLVSSEFEYSLYAFSHQYSSGLIPYWFRYSPYAFSHKHPSGLIDDYGYGYYWWPYYPYDYYYFTPAHRPVSEVVPNPSNSLEEMRENYEERLRIRQERIRKLKKDAEERRKQRENDGKWIICEYLKSKGIKFDIVDGFYFRNQTVNAVFLIRAKKWLIRYQNSELEKSLAENPLWEQYKERREEKEKEYQAAGWRICDIKF